MILKKDFWNKEDIVEFQSYLKTFDNKIKKEWHINILKTSLPILIMKTQEVNNIVKEISEGNYLSFLDFMVWEYYENTAINGSLINLIEDFDTMKKYLDIYSAKAENWATCDLLEFKVLNRENQFYELAKEYTQSKKEFVKRIGLYILFNLIENDNYIDKIFEILNNLKSEEQYYVNMMGAWLLSECFIRQREKTLVFLKNNTLDKSIVNKGIQKCRESRRVSPEDKEMLLQFKVKRKK